MEQCDKTKEFIHKASLIHGDKYDYSKVQFKKAIEKVIIICKTHGDFKLTPNKHLSRADGCKICGRELIGDKLRKTTEDFVKEAKLKHVDENGVPIYHYEKVDYKNNGTKVSIICKKHGIFNQTPGNHLYGYGCKKCRNDNSGSSQRLTKEQFIEKAKLKHIDETRFPLYSYEKVIYTNSHTKIIVTCKIHGDFEITPNNHLNGSTCLKCSNEKSSERQRLTTDEFLRKAKEIHGDTYDYSKTIYGKNNNEPINIICYKHGLFNQSPTSHLAGKGCKLCGNEKSSERQRFTLEECINKFRYFHCDRYDYNMVEYVNTSTNVKIRCIEHNILFNQTPANHFRSSGCMKCHKYGYSKKAILWLNFISKLHNIDIQHAENGHEYKIPNTRIRTDGYCKEINTIYEFHGDFWHGNPKKYAFADINCISNMYFGELYKNTIEREKQIQELGYNLVVIWENDWNKLNKGIKIIQNLFRNSRH